MKILALESSATAASVALCEGDRLVAQHFLQTGLTHSQTLLPMVESLLKDCHLNLTELDLLAVAAGPGSFTGLRIGISTIKGLAWATDLPCAACSTLEAMAWHAVGLSGELCAVMDARRGEVYNARFSSDGERIVRLTPDRAIALPALALELRESGKTAWCLGDGAALCASYLEEQGIPVRLAPPNLRMQNAWGVARLALALWQEGKCVPAAQLLPSYLRLSQAERERLEREAAGKG